MDKNGSVDPGSSPCYHCGQRSVAISKQSGEAVCAQCLKTEEPGPSPIVKTADCHQPGT